MPPANDNFADAELVAPGTIAGTTIDATSEDPYETDYYGDTASVWYYYYNSSSKPSLVTFSNLSGYPDILGEVWRYPYTSETFNYGPALSPPALDYDWFFSSAGSVYDSFTDIYFIVYPGQYAYMSVMSEVYQDDFEFDFSIFTAPLPIVSMTQAPEH